MTTSAPDPRSNFYRQESDEGSHLSPAYNQAVLVELLSRIRNTRVRRIADLGSGAGLNVPTLRTLFRDAQIITMDLSWSALAIGRRTLDAVSPAQSDASAIPLASGSLDLIVCTEVLEHVGEMSAVVAEMHRVLHKTGVAVISSPNYLNPMGVRKWLNDRRLGDSFWDPWGGHPGFERLMHPRLVNRALSPYFTLDTVRGAGFMMGWIPLGYRRIGNINDRYPLRWLGRLPLVRQVAINRYLLLRKKDA
jgi:SAM-dependent methyltransferase